MTESLLAIQQRDRKLAQLTKESRDVPERKKMIANRLEDHQKALTQAREALNRNTVAIRELENEIETQKARIRKYREQQFQIKNNEEYRALEREINSANILVRQHEDKALMLMEAVEGLGQDVTEKDMALKAEAQVVAQEHTLLDERAQAIEQETAQVRADREACTVEVNPEALRRYERILAHVGDQAVVPIEGTACGGCHMTIPPYLIKEARSSASFTLCSYCGRILFVR